MYVVIYISINKRTHYVKPGEISNNYQETNSTNSIYRYRKFMSIFVLWDGKKFTGCSKLMLRPNIRMVHVTKFNCENVIYNFLTTLCNYHVKNLGSRYYRI